MRGAAAALLCMLWMQACHRCHAGKKIHRLCSAHAMPLQSQTCLPHVHARPACADQMLVFTAPFVLYQRSAADPLVRMGSMTLPSFRSSTFLCSYPDGEQPASGLQYLLLPATNESRCSQATVSWCCMQQHANPQTCIHASLRCHAPINTVALMCAPL